MLVQDQPDLPTITQGGLDIGPIDLPPPHHAASAPHAEEPTHLSSRVAAAFELSVPPQQMFAHSIVESGHSGKLAYVREQFLEHGLNFLGLQETRTDRTSALQSNVLRLAGGCEHGQLGVELWINLAQPFARQGKRPLLFQRRDFVVVVAQPRILFVHVRNPALDLWLLVAHAPHSGTEQSLRAQWWHDLSSLLDQHVAHHHLLAMVDANAASGRRDDRHIFTIDDVTTVKTPLLREFLEGHSLCLPATLPLHQGDRATWQSPSDDSLHRIDFVNIPCQWRLYCNWSEGLDALDFGHLGDHRAVAMQLHWTDKTLRPQHGSPIPAMIDQLSRLPI